MATIAKLLVEMNMVDRGVATSIARISNMVDGLNAKLMAAGAIMTLGITTPIVAGFGAAIKQATSFEKEIVKLEALVSDELDKLGLNHKEVMGQIEKQAFDAAQASVFSAQEIIQGYQEMSRAGISVADLIGGAGQAAIDLATATDMPLAKAGEIMAITMNQFQLDGAEAARVSDVLVASANNTATSVTSLGQSLSYTGGAAHVLNISLEETVAMLGMMADAGLKGSRTGTNLQAALTMMASPPPEAAEKWGELGISLQDTEGNFRGMEPILTDLNAQLSQMGNMERLDVLDTLFGKLGGRAVNAMLLAINGLEDMNKYDEEGNILEFHDPKDAEKAAKSYRDYVNELTSSGQAHTQAQKMLSSTAGAFEKFKNTVGVALIQMGQLFLPFVKALILGLTGLVRMFLALPKSVKASIAMFLLLIATVGPLLFLIGALGIALGFLLSPLALLTAGLAALATFAAFTSDTLKSFLEVLGHLPGLLTDAFKSGDGVDDLWQVLFGPGAIFENAPQLVKDVTLNLLKMADALGDIWAAYRKGGMDGVFDVLGEELSNIQDAAVEITVDIVVAIGEWILGTGQDLYASLKMKIEEWLGLGGAATPDATNATQGMTGGMPIGVIALAVEGWLISGGEGLYEEFKAKIFGWLGGNQGGGPDATGGPSNLQSLGGIPIGTVALMVGGFIVNGLDRIWSFVSAEVHRAWGEFGDDAVNIGKVTIDIAGLALGQVYNIPQWTSSLRSWASEQRFRLEGWAVDLGAPSEDGVTIDWSGIWQVIAGAISKLWHVSPGSMGIVGANAGAFGRTIGSNIMELIVNAISQVMSGDDKQWNMMTGTSVEMAPDPNIINLVAEGVREFLRGTFEGAFAQIGTDITGMSDADFEKWMDTASTKDMGRAVVLKLGSLLLEDVMDPTDGLGAEIVKDFADPTDGLGGSVVSAITDAFMDFDAGKTGISGSIGEFAGALFDGAADAIIGPVLDFVNDIKMGLLGAIPDWLIQLFKGDVVGALLTLASGKGPPKQDEASAYALTGAGQPSVEDAFPQPQTPLVGAPGWGGIVLPALSEDFQPPSQASFDDLVANRGLDDPLQYPIRVEPAYGWEATTGDPVSNTLYNEAIKATELAAQDPFFQGDGPGAIPVQEANIPVQPVYGWEATTGDPISNQLYNEAMKATADAKSILNDLGKGGEQFRPAMNIQQKVNLKLTKGTIEPSGGLSAIIQQSVGNVGGSGLGSGLGALGGASNINIPVVAKISADISAFTTAAATVVMAGNLIGSTTFTATIAANNGPAMNSIGAAIQAGNLWGGAVFTATLNADAGQVMSAYNVAMSVGQAWASQVFTATMNVNSVVSAPPANIPQNASGGIFSGLSWVGERGPELVYASQARVFNAAEARNVAADGYGSSGGGDSYSFGDMTFIVQGADLDEEQVADAVFDKFRNELRFRTGK